MRRDFLLWVGVPFQLRLNTLQPDGIPEIVSLTTKDLSGVAIPAEAMISKELQAVSAKGNAADPEGRRQDSISGKQQLSPHDGRSRGSDEDRSENEDQRHKKRRKKSHDGFSELVFLCPFYLKYPDKIVDRSCRTSKISTARLK
jgi:hypothetical protein